uniref:Isopropylmalate dehydrogenase-like domain-containing protein n=1 Tax=Compsopogon caeruleus TaxID=31354 RepID=A0A7S1XD78_9RHOD|mmetsp:Transcript_18444/g.38630  ORF Transcript_18444/g.38630 Transcript_18444/m.38630 type:complete len:375 (+) Transcript_18444:1173-2297(+)
MVCSWRRVASKVYEARPLLKSFRNASSLPLVNLPRDHYPAASGRLTQVPVTLIPGHGIGREATDAMVEVFDHAEAPIEWERFEFDEQAHDIPSEVLASFAKTKVAVKGPFFTSLNNSRKSLNVRLRTTLDLYANVVQAVSIQGVETRHKNVDLVVIRENTEGEYSGLEHEVVPGVVESLKVISREKSTRIARYAFEYALRHNRKKVTVVHKANIMKQSDGLFLECCRSVAADYPFLQFETMIVDNTCMQLTWKPQQFDVMVMPNLYGNIVTNLATGLVGGPGLFPGVNIGERGAIFEQGARHAALSIAGKNIANPTATILSGVMLLRHLGLDEHADLIETAVQRVYAESKTRTPDVGGSASTTEFVSAVIARMN